MIIFGGAAGFIGWFVIRYVVTGFFTVDQNERAVKTRFGRAERVGTATTIDDAIAKSFDEEERQRYCYPQVRVIPPGGPYFKWPWEEVHKVSIATQTMNMAYDPEAPAANTGGTLLEAVTKDQLQHRPDGPDPLSRLRAQSLRVSLRRQEPDRARDGLFRLRPARAHRQLRSASPPGDWRPKRKPGPASAAIGISINDLRKNLRDLNEHMDSANARRRRPATASCSTPR